MSDSSLDGIGVLITRPRQQSIELAEEIEALGGTAIVFPSIDIVARDEDAIANDLAGLSSKADITIFISRNAVQHGIGYASGNLAAIGPTTAEEIERAGQSLAIQPSAGFDSEHLLAEAAFDNIDGKTIRIIRGNVGREKLAETLSERGAKVEYLSTYERRVPVYTANVLMDLENRWRAGEIDAVVVMSVQSLVNLQLLLPEWCLRQLPKTLLVTPATRVLKEALSQLPGCHAILAAGPRAGEIANSLAATTSLPKPATLKPD